MTKEQMDDIRERLDAATPGPWEAVTPKRYAAVRSEKAGCYVYTQGKIPADTHADTVTRQQRDAHLIANAPTDLRALLDEVERLTKREDELVKAGLDLMVANKDLTAERDTAFRRGAEAFQRGVETFRRHMYAFALGATSYSRPSNESQLILDELPRMQVDDPEDR